MVGKSDVNVARAGRGPDCLIHSDGTEAQTALACWEGNKQGQDCFHGGVRKVAHVLEGALCQGKPRMVAKACRHAFDFFDRCEGLVCAGETIPGTIQNVCAAELEAKFDKLDFIVGATCGQLYEGELRTGDTACFVDTYEGTGWELTVSVPDNIVALSPGVAATNKEMVGLCANAQAGHIVCKHETRRHAQAGNLPGSRLIEQLGDEPPA